MKKGQKYQKKSRRKREARDTEEPAEMQSKVVTSRENQRPSLQKDPGRGRGASRRTREVRMCVVMIC
jgi:hypothetical protein